jgi:flagellar protein FliO/FliZ
MGLVLVLGLILGGLWLLKRLSSPGVGDGVLHVVAGIAVGPRERVVLVEIGDTWLVLGVAPGQVNTLHQLPRLEAGPRQVRKPIPAHDFRNWLENALERKHAAR